MEHQGQIGGSGGAPARRAPALRARAASMLQKRQAHGG